MLTKRHKEALSASQKHGWVMEPECKQILRDIGISVPKFRVITEWEEVVERGERGAYGVAESKQ